MPTSPCRTICWTPLWNKVQQGAGLEHLLLREGEADSVVLAIDDERGPFRLDYSLRWNERWQLRSADFSLTIAGSTRSLHLRTDGQGHWQDGQGQTLGALAGCLDIDIWPTPFTNSFPIRRQAMAVGERREFRMAWVFGPELTVRPQAQAYTRIGERLYLFEILDGSGFQAELPVDEDGVVRDYPGLFRRADA